MALAYRNTLKGHVVSMSEPAEILAAAEVEAERLARKGTKRDRQDAELVMDKAQSQALHMRQTLAKMDESRRWERYMAPPVVAGPSPAPKEAAQPAVELPAKVAKPAMKAARAEPEQAEA